MLSRFVLPPNSSELNSQLLLMFDCEGNMRIARNEILLDSFMLLASSFSYLQENHDRWVGVCYSKVVYSARRLQGNTAILEIVGVSAAVRKVLSDVFLGLVPLQRSGSRMFYGSSPNEIIIVDTDMGIWKEYTFEYAEDVPSVADLLEGALDHIHESNCKDMEDVASYSVYQRTQARPMIVPTFV